MRIRNRKWKMDWLILSTTLNVIGSLNYNKLSANKLASELVETNHNRENRNFYDFNVIRTAHCFGQ